jgi:hypothetical protein
LRLQCRVLITSQPGLHRSEIGFGFRRARFQRSNPRFVGRQLGFISRDAVRETDKISGCR